MHLRAIVPASLATALLLWSAAPAVGLGWLVWVALVPVAFVTLRFAGTRGGRLAVPLAYTVYLELLLVPALPFGLAHDQWAKPIVPLLVGDSPVVVVAAVAIPLFGLALYTVRFPDLGTSRGGLATVLVPALAWTALDVVRTKADPGGLWGPLFLSQHDTAAAGLAALAGPWLLTFEIVLVNYAAALALSRGRAALPAVATTVALALAPVAALLVADRATRPAGRALAVAAVQPGYDTAEFDRPVLHYLRRAHRDLERATLDLVADLAPLTRRAAAKGARLVVWPEATAWVEPAGEASVRAALANLARETDAALVVPYFIRSGGESAAIVVLPTGALSAPQPKQRPMWFVGERAGDGEPGRPVAAGALAVGTLLGVDNQDPASVRRLAVRGADVLTASTHDWEALAEQQRAFTRLHAVALDVPIVRADWRYGSAVFAPDGRIVADAPAGKRRAAVVGRVDAGAGGTPYARSGDAAAWLALAAALGILVARPLARLARGLGATARASGATRARASGSRR